MQIHGDQKITTVNRFVQKITTVFVQNITTAKNGHYGISFLRNFGNSTFGGVFIFERSLFRGQKRSLFFGQIGLAVVIFRTTRSLFRGHPLHGAPLNSLSSKNNVFLWGFAKFKKYKSGPKRKLRKKRRPHNTTSNLLCRN